MPDSSFNDILNKSKSFLETVAFIIVLGVVTINIEFVFSVFGADFNAFRFDQTDIFVSSLIMHFLVKFWIRPKFNKLSSVTHAHK